MMFLAVACGAAPAEHPQVETDAATKQVFEGLVNDEEGHFDEFDRQMENIKRFGPNYLALQSFGTAPPAAGSAG